MIDCAVDRLKEPRPHFLLFAILDGLEQQILQRYAFEQLAEHVIDTSAQRFTRSFELFQQARVDFAFAGVGGDDVPQVAHFRLADPVDTAKALLDLVRVPWQIVVHHQMAALKVHAFAGGIVGDEHQHVPVLHEALDHLAALFAGHAAVDDFHGLRTANARANLLQQVVQRVLGLGKDDQLAAVAVLVDRQVVIEDAVELLPFGVLAGVQHTQGHLSRPLSVSTSIASCSTVSAVVAPVEITSSISSTSS